MADYKSKEPVKTLTVTTTIRGITSLLSNLDEIKLVAERLKIPSTAEVNLAANKDGWSDSVTFTYDIKATWNEPKVVFEKPNPRYGKTEWYGPPLNL